MRNGKAKPGRDAPLPRQVLSRTFTLDAQAFAWLVWMRDECERITGHRMTLDQVLNSTIIVVGRRDADRTRYMPDCEGK